MIRLLGIGTVCLFVLLVLAAGRELLKEHSSEHQITVLEQTGDLAGLIALYEQDPKSFVDNPQALTKVARARLFSGNEESYEELREQHRNDESVAPHLWFALDVDHLLWQGREDEAVQKLQGVVFDPTVDVARVVRLAKLGQCLDVSAAWEVLAIAHENDPHNADIRLARGAILEQLGQLEVAQEEFQAAVAEEQRNLLLRDELAEFYRRNGMYPAAITTWLEGIQEESSIDFYWVKLLFWRTVAAPYGFVPTTLPEGVDQPLIAELMKLEPGQFWGEQLANWTTQAHQRQELFWLRLFHLVKESNEREAYNLLVRQPFGDHVWNQELAEALLATLRFRQTGNLPPENCALIADDDESALLPLLESNEVFAALCMKAGWFEAALKLHTIEELPSTFPTWVAYGITQAKRYNRGEEEALAFAVNQAPSPELSLLIGELLLAMGKTKEGISQLEGLLDGPQGLRAAWLLALVAIDAGDLEQAQDRISHHPVFASSLVGIELRARLALLEGNPFEAHRLYSQIRSSSPEAEHFLSSFALQSVTTN